MPTGLKIYLALAEMALLKAKEKQYDSPLCWPPDPAKELQKTL
jgi:hypothetical protein